MGGAEKVGGTKIRGTGLPCVLVQVGRKNALTVVTTALLRIGLLALAMLFFVRFVRADMRRPVPECTGASIAPSQSSIPSASMSFPPAVIPTGGSATGPRDMGAAGAMCKLPTD